MDGYLIEIKLVDFLGYMAHNDGKTHSRQGWHSITAPLPRLLEEGFMLYMHFAPLGKGQWAVTGKSSQIAEVTVGRAHCAVTPTKGHAVTPDERVSNQAFVDKFMSGQDPIGHAVSMGKGRFSEIRIVGVVADMKQFSVTEPTKPEIYFCLAQTDPGSALYGIVTAFMQVAIRAAIPANSLRAQFDKALHEVAPDAVITDVKTIHEAAEDSFGAQTLIARLLETFAGLALIIASIGLYGLLSFSVAQRTREIGIRIALGSPQANILALVIRHAMILVSIGLGVGGVLAWFAVKFASSYIYGVRAHDALTFVAVAFVLIVSCLFATWLPSRRAVAIDPMKALRTE